MSTIRPVELDTIDLVFRGGERGYVLDFSNRTLSEFFALELDVDIEADLYQREGTSKGKRLRGFLSIVDDGTAAKILRLLWNIARLCSSGITIWMRSRSPRSRCSPLWPAWKARRPGYQWVWRRRRSWRSRTGPACSTGSSPSGIFRPTSGGTRSSPISSSCSTPFGLAARQPFRLDGEQIDGSFHLAGETYLLEAKWLNRKVSIAELHGFHGKIGEKAAWARGLFVSFGGFTAPGLGAFGRGKSLVCMEGREIRVALEREIGIDAVILSKVRRAAETGEVFTPIEVLFPE